MALNFTVSYTFSPSTTISSSQVNTNTSDVASVFQGLEAVTKSFSRLQVDAAPTVAADVVRKDYVDRYSTWRRPVLQYGSVTTIAVESGLDGTSGDIPMLFPDGTFRTETSTTRTTFNITRNAVLVTSGAQSGLTGATSEASNTWYALYACKVTDSSTLWVTVGSTVLPLQANYATLNTAYGTSGWVYLGLVRNGDNSGATADLQDFVMGGNTTLFQNVATGANGSAETNGIGLRLATTAGSNALTYTSSRGTGTTSVPNNVPLVYYDGVYITDGTPRLMSLKVGGTPVFNAFSTPANTTNHIKVFCPYAGATLGASAGNMGMDIFLNGFVDGVLGVGSNPLL